MEIKFCIDIKVEGQDTFHYGDVVDNISKDLHKAVILYMRDHYKKSTCVSIEFTHLENHFCKNCNECTIAEIGKDETRCTRCGVKDKI